MSAPGWKVGDPLQERTLPPITRLGLIKYAGASGDFNPIHTVDEAAEEAGLPGVIAHGMLTAATVGNLLSPHLDAGYVKSLYTRFSGMVLVGDELRVGGEVSSVEESGEGTVFTLEVRVRRGESDVIASGSVEFFVPNPRAG
jgi:acyl dehydratase